MTAQFSYLSGSLEFEFVRTCICTHLSVERESQIRSLLEGGELDWEELIKLAFLHQVTPLLYKPVKNIYPALVPEEILDAFDVYYKNHQATNRLLLQELLSILQLFDREGIVAIPFKGPMIAEQLYGDLSLRMFRDLDFLIQEKNIQPVLHVLKKEGYRVASNLSRRQQSAFWRYAGQDIYYQPDKKISLEPHWAFAPRTLGVDIDYAALFQNAKRIDLKQCPVYSFSPEDTLIILCVHGCKEIWGQLKWICDIAVLIDTNPDLQWDIVFLRAARQGCLRMVYLGLLLAHQVCGSMVSEEIKMQINSDKRAQRLAGQIRQRIVSNKVENIDVYQFTAFRWHMRERWSDRWRYFWRTITTPRLRHFSIIQLPDAFWWGYYPIKIAHDYGAEPVWSLLKWIFRNKAGNNN